jgi:pimeloyl-ACP methyl ester carboxylesterase
MSRTPRPAGALRVREWALPAPAVTREVRHAEPEQPSERPPLLFVHGLAHGAWCWDEGWLTGAAERGWSAHAVSLRAHGASGGRERRRRTRLSEYEHDLLQEAARLPRPPVVVAHSLGCVVAARVAARYPFAAVVLLAPVDVTQGLDLLAHTARRAPLHVARMTAGLPVQLTDADLFHGLDDASARAHLARLDPEPPLVQLQILLRRPPGTPVGRPPVLVYGAEHDTLVPARGVERTARFYGVPARWLPDIGHDVMLDEGSKRALETVLSDLESALDPATTA